MDPVPPPVSSWLFNRWTRTIAEGRPSDLPRGTVDHGTRVTQIKGMNRPRFRVRLSDPYTIIVR